MMKKKSDAVEYGQKCIEMLRTLGVNGETVIELTQQDDHQDSLRDLLGNFYFYVRNQKERIFNVIPSELHCWKVVI